MESVLIKEPENLCFTGLSWYHFCYYIIFTYKESNSTLKKQFSEVRQILNQMIEKMKQYLPTFVSMCNLACGFGAIVFIMNKEVHYAAWLIIVAMICDGLDGQLARMMKVKLDWGGHFDTLADLVTFGVVPAFLIGSMDIFGPHIAIWFVCFFFTLCAAIRLARFEAQQDHDTARCKYFTGLPTTLAGGTIASLVLLDTYLKGVLDLQIVSKGLPSIVFILSILMLSKVQYIKIIDAFKKRHDSTQKLKIIVLFSVLLVSLILYPHLMLSIGFTAYVIFGNLGIFKKRTVHTI